MEDRYGTEGVGLTANRLLLIEAAGLVAGFAYLRAVDPHNPRAVMPICPIKRISGLDCPACGALRVVHDLLHADARSAFYDNAFLLVSSPALVYLLILHVRSLRTQTPLEVPKVLAYGLAAAAVAWMVVRNFPGWPLKPTRTS
jgi:hypothetical protein